MSPKERLNLTSIKLTITGARVRASVTGPLTSGMVGLPVTIEYDKAWDGLTKNLVCRCSRGAENAEYRTILNVENTAVVAHEVMRAGTLLYLGVEGFSTDGMLVIPTVWVMCGAIEKGANTGADLSADPTLPVWGQLQAQIDQIKGGSVLPEQLDEIRAYTEAAAQAEENARTSAANAANMANDAFRYQQAAEAAAERAESAEVPVENGNSLSGKYLSVLGDSISTYPGYIPDGYSCYYAANLMPDEAYMWWHRLMTALGMNLCVNNAYSGSCVAIKTGVAEGFSGCQTVRNMRLHTDAHIPDIIIVQMGTNDYVQKIPVGEYDLNDGEVFDTTTFSGAYAKTLWNITSRYPNSRIYCATLPKMRNNRDTAYPVSGMDVYNDAIRRIADMFGCGIVDFSACGITAANVPNYMIDGRIHPNQHGQALMGNQAIADIAPYVASRSAVLDAVLNEDAVLDDGDSGGAGDSGDAEPDTPEGSNLVASYDFTGGNSVDGVGEMDGTDTEISYTADGAVFGAESLIDFGQYDLTNKTVEIDVGAVTGESGYVFVPNNFNTSLYKGLKFDSVWAYMGADNSTNNSEVSDVQAVAGTTLKFVYGAASSGYIPVEVFFGDTSIISIPKAAYTGGYLYLGNGASTLAMTIRAMRIYENS